MILLLTKPRYLEQDDVVVGAPRGFAPPHHVKPLLFQPRRAPFDGTSLSTFGGTFQMPIIFL